MTPTRAGSPSPMRLEFTPSAIASSSNPEWLVLMSKYWAVENQSSAMFRPGERFQSRTSRSGFAYGSGRRRSALVTLKIDVFAPMPRASERIAAAASPGLFRMPRRAYLRSDITAAYYRTSVAQD